VPALLAGVAWPVLSAGLPDKPKLVVAIAVDQFSADLFNEYRAMFTDGFKRLAGGVVFPRGYQGHAATETCPGHSTILTGSRPARTGIIANDWQSPSLGRVDAQGRPAFGVYCVENPGAPGSSNSVLEISPQFLRVPTLGDRLKSVDARSRVVSVSGKDRAAIMLGGHHADVTLWWNGQAFVTYAQHEASVPAGITAINARARAAIARPMVYRLPASCVARSKAVTLADNTTVGTLQPRAPGDERRWRATPEFDTLTLDAALTTMDALKLGHGPATDVLAISLSATDYTGHAYGTEGAEMCVQMLALDHALGRLSGALDKSGVNYIVVLTADHGGHDLPERNRMRALSDAERVDRMLAANVVGTLLARQFGLPANVLVGRAAFGDMYLSAAVPVEKRTAIRDAAVAFYRAQRQVAAVFTRDELLAASAPVGPVDDWSLIERARASFDAERSGDFIVLLKPYVTPIPDAMAGAVATHGSPWDYDRRVPILFWWQGVQGFEQPNAVETVDILPTLASVIGLDVPPAEIDGRCLDLLAGNASNCQ